MRTGGPGAAVGRFAKQGTHGTRARKNTKARYCISRMMGQSAVNWEKTCVRGATGGILRRYRIDEVWEAEAGAALTLFFRLVYKRYDLLPVREG